jgi:hypothetical protein
VRLAPLHHRERLGRDYETHHPDPAPHRRACGQHWRASHAGLATYDDELLSRPLVRIGRE